MVTTDALSLLDRLNDEMKEGRPIEEIEKAWDHYYLLRSYCELYRSADKRVMDALEHLHAGLSTFTLHVRQGVLSPYSGFRTQIRVLRRHLDYQVGEDGWPKNPRHL